LKKKINEFLRKEIMTLLRKAKKKVSALICHPGKKRVKTACSYRQTYTHKYPHKGESAREKKESKLRGRKKSAKGAKKE